MIWIDFWPYDLVVKGSIDFESEITDHAIEDGGQVNDHVTRKPISIKLETIVSDTPIGEVAFHESRQVPELTEAERVDLVNTFGDANFDNLPLPSAEAYERLEAIWKESRAVTVEIPFATRTGKPGKRTFKNMEIEKLSVPLDPKHDGGGWFEVTLKQLTIVQNKRVTIKTAVPRGQPKRTKKATVGEAYRVDNVVTWQMGFPAGSALTPVAPWAVVEIEVTDKTVGNRRDQRTRYFYSGESSTGDNSRAPIPPNYGFKTSGQLPPTAVEAFRLDFGRDVIANKEKWRKAAQETGSDGATYNPRGPGKAGEGGMPAGYEPGRFTPPKEGYPKLGPTGGNMPDVVNERRGEIK